MYSSYSTPERRALSGPPVRSSVAVGAAAALAFSGEPTLILEILFVAFIAWRVLREPAVLQTPFRIFLVCLAYIAAGYFSSLPSTSADLKDFATIYKFLYYLAALALVSSDHWIQPRSGAWGLRLFVWLFVMVYTYERFAIGELRPTVLVENNYELIPLILAAVALNGKGKPLSPWDWGALLYVCAISGSRSSMAALAIGITVLVRLQFSARELLQWTVLAGAFGLLVYVLVLRLGDRSIEDIDRIIFLSAFVEETKDWGVAQWLFGAPAMTPLSLGTCRMLAYYENLMSYTGEWKCYSVILHSFVLRVIYDHGLLGFALSLFAVNLLLKRDYNGRVRVTVLAIIVATGLSVSSLNNVYVALGLMFMLALRPLQLAARVGSIRR
ncbi:hypothetical protein EZ313_17995 [Ramlibacter henchirensis]|uniref:O-antigen ligase domain-containing protein n=1 Tax=Ramlibacter henchirensis TaxID=204072 RepID=A0A4Z0BX74_9BURK|nr:hypothetical protein [Ramlibacter henchirensis]TFZ03104.1 hypothetical protein EZ313_17995 [Ramlibacter henchirensis]